MILTATATKATKSEILSSLYLKEDDVKFIEQSPNRTNLKYTVEYLHKNVALQTAFSSLIFELKTLGSKTPRTLLYCQTRKQCHILFRVSTVANILSHLTTFPSTRLCILCIHRLRLSSTILISQPSTAYFSSLWTMLVLATLTPLHRMQASQKKPLAHSTLLEQKIVWRLLSTDSWKMPLFKEEKFPWIGCKQQFLRPTGYCQRDNHCWDNV